LTEREPVATDWIALYGSLMRGFDAMDELGFGDRLRYAGPCVLAGELFDLGPYPGMRHGDGRVVAELYALLDDGVIEDLDRFEDFEPSRPRDSIYLRERVALVEPARTEAWVYVYNAVPDASARIVGGDWRAHFSARAND
jgi:gamma-glutamylcyclotransferase (GGCT)/AIG2-like uncharacterized protein YtfP